MKKEIAGAKAFDGSVWLLQGAKEMSFKVRGKSGRGVSPESEFYSSLKIAVYFPQVLNIKTSRIKHVNNWQIVLEILTFEPTFLAKYQKLKFIVILPKKLKKIFSFFSQNLAANGKCKKDNCQTPSDFILGSDSYEKTHNTKL